MTNPAQLQDRLIMVVDDNIDNLKVVLDALQSDGYRTIQTTDGEEALDLLKVSKPDLILLDVNMSRMSGFDVLKQVRTRPGYVSVIFLTARSGSADIISGLDAGADDYIVKPFDVDILLARVRAQLRIKDLNDRLSDANQRLQELVDTDDLTGLFNMRSIYDKLDAEIYRSRRYGKGVCAVMMDMDDFKSVNDTHDHLFGSYVLARVGRIINDTIRKVDFAARYGGDEFLIVLVEADEDGGLSFCERMRRRIEKELFAKDGAEMRLTASLGISFTEGADEGINARTLVRQADHALYDAKHAGKNCVRVHNGMHSRSGSQSGPRLGLAKRKASAS